MQTGPFIAIKHLLLWRPAFLITSLLHTIPAGAVQNTDSLLLNDSLTPLQGITVEAYLGGQPLLMTPSATTILDSRKLRQQPQQSFTGVLNTIPGVRAEERSPGSYRISVRGSLLRSPYGIRDIKIYLEDVLLTDAGGNTYLNALDITGIQKIEVLKGPDGSLFGANSGGVLRLSTSGDQATPSGLHFGLSAGSFGLMHQHAGIQNQWKNNKWQVNQSYQQYKGYREHSRMHRFYMQTGNEWSYASGTLKALVLYSDLSYQTPGGLTREQADSTPRAARLATPTQPGAAEQQAGIGTRLALLGLTNTVGLSPSLNHTLALFGTGVNFKNPFITNFEERREYTYGLRSFFEWIHPNPSILRGKVHLGIEWQQTRSKIGNYGNIRGEKDTLQRLDNIRTTQYFVFTRYALDVRTRLHMEFALSLNYYHYHFQNIFPAKQTAYRARYFQPQLMPRLAMSYAIGPGFIWRASASRGYSRPTVAEIRPTDNIINTHLNAAYGWSYETGMRLSAAGGKIMLDASLFYYLLKNAIVRRLHQDETEYFINSGGARQIGMEVIGRWIWRPVHQGFIRKLEWSEAFSYNQYTFLEYVVTGSDYSGNPVTGVPRSVLLSGILVDFPEDFSIFIQHNRTGKIPVNDAATVYAAPYHLLQAKLNWKYTCGAGPATLEIFVRADNLLNEAYSLGNDLNAAGGRYYNPAPTRNYTVGFLLSGF